MIALSATARGYTSYSTFTNGFESLKSCIDRITRHQNSVLTNTTVGANVRRSVTTVWTVMSVVATEGTNSTSESGKVHLGPVREDSSYDQDGNLTSDSRRDYTWDPENRLKSIETRSAAVSARGPKTRLGFGYDAEGRRTSKSVLTNWDGSVYLATHITRFIFSWATPKPRTTSPACSRSSITPAPRPSATSPPTTATVGEAIGNRQFAICHRARSITDYRLPYLPP